jgi:cell division protein ZapA (FtsZ GTPase activity inhibitor)
MVAEYVSAKMTEIKQSSASSDKLRIAILSALNIAGELMEHKSKHEACEKALREYQSKIESLSQKIEQVI